MLGCNSGGTIHTLRDATFASMGALILSGTENHVFKLQGRRTGSSIAGCDMIRRHSCQTTKIACSVPHVTTEIWIKQGS